MSRHDSTGQLQGFTVYQPALGAQLLFFPSLGSNELDQLIDAYLPGPASAKEKRATISIDFLDHARLTGDTFKFYTVDSSNIVSPASASSVDVWDSTFGSASGFGMSPALSDVTSWSFASLPQTQQDIPAAPTVSRQQQHKSRPAKKASPPMRHSTDFTSLPGMKILTKDGRDVTNSASRGCKTKEQRDHAHLMRIIKACDACRRKKIRCDPSHKKRTASSQSQAEAKPAKKAKKTVVESPPVLLTPALDASLMSFDLNSVPIAPLDAAVLPDNSWEQFVEFDQTLNFPPTDLDFSLNSTDSFSPTDLPSSSSSSLFTSNTSSSSSPSQPFTPTHPHPSPVNVALDAQPLQQQQQPAALPYIDAFQAGADYVDFNLYSPQSNFVDEEPITLRSAQVSPVAWEAEPVESCVEPRLETIEQPWSFIDSPAPSLLPDVQQESLLGVGGQYGTLDTPVSQLVQFQPTPSAIPTHNTQSHVLSSPSSNLPSASVNGESVRVDGLAQPYGNWYRHIQATLERSGDAYYILQSPAHSDSYLEHGTDTLVSQSPPQSDVASRSVGSSVGSSSSVSSTAQVDVRWPAASGTPATGMLPVTSSGLVSRLGSTPTSISTYATHVGGVADRYESRVDNVNNASQPSRSNLAAVDSFSQESHRSSLDAASPVVAGGSELVSDNSDNVVAAWAASVYCVGFAGFQVLSSGAGLGLGNGGVGSSSFVDGALVLAAALMLVVLNGVVLTLQAGSAKMPEGLFGLVYGGVVALAQALWPHTPPRSSKPTPEDHCFSSAPSGGKAVVGGGWFYGRMPRAWRHLQCSMGKKIGRFSGFMVVGGRQMSSWRV